MLESAKLVGFIPTKEYDRARAFYEGKLGFHFVRRDIAAVARWLADCGVPPEKFPFVQDRDLGIWTAPDVTRVAWFKDPDGNISSSSPSTRSFAGPPTPPAWQDVCIRLPAL